MQNNMVPNDWVVRQIERSRCLRELRAAIVAVMAVVRIGALVTLVVIVELCNNFISNAGKIVWNLPIHTTITVAIKNKVHKLHWGKGKLI